MTVPRASFYLLKQGAPERLLQTACRLAARAAAEGGRLFIQAADEAQLRELDEWLWSFPAESFLPHQRTDEAGLLSAPLLIGLKRTTSPCDICLNVSNRPVENPEGYRRILELFPAEESARLLARQRWLHYKHLGFSLDHHDV